MHGAMIQVLSHGLAVAGLFLLLGLLEQRRGAAWLQVHGLATRAPRFAVVVMLFVLASLALPLTSGFVAEFLVLLGAFTTGYLHLAGRRRPRDAARGAVRGDRRRARRDLHAAVCAQRSSSTTRA